MSKLSLLGLYRFKKMRNIDLFQNLSVPTGIDKDTLVNNILLKAADFEILYPDADMMIEAIGLWSDKWQYTFKKWVDAQAISYNPLDNYDRTESWKESTTGETSSSSGSTGTNYRSAYDSSTLQINDSDISQGTTSDNTNVSNEHEGRTHGNIGVTSSQQLLNAEYDIALWNIYEHITDIFLEEFCILVY